MNTGATSSTSNQTTPAFSASKARGKKPTTSIEIDGVFVEYNYGPGIEYFGEYKAKLQNNTVSFPLNSCDPLPLHQVGDTKFFFTSAQNGYNGGTCLNNIGFGIQVTDPDIKQLAVVRGKNPRTAERIQFYIGFDPDNFKLSADGTKKIFSGKILYIHAKNTAHVDQLRQYFDQDSCKTLTNQALGLEVRKHLADPNDYNWNSPVFLKILKDLFDKFEGVEFHNQDLIMRTCYWTQHENVLKGITYNSSSSAAPKFK